MQVRAKVGDLCPAQEALQQVMFNSTAKFTGNLLFLAVSCVFVRRHFLRVSSSFWWFLACAFVDTFESMDTCSSKVHCHVTGNLPFLAVACVVRP